LRQGLQQCGTGKNAVLSWAWRHKNRDAHWAVKLTKAKPHEDGYLPQTRHLTKSATQKIDQTHLHVATNWLIELSICKKAQPSSDKSLISMAWESFMADWDREPQ
jgi:hypothetical protein